MEKKTLREKSRNIMEQQSTRLRNAGFATFFFSGICSIRAGMVVSLLQERYGFAYGMTGSLLSLLSIGNLLAGFLIGVLPAASGGAILMPWVVGIVSEKAGLAAGMASNIVPCVGLVLFTLLVARLPEE